MKRILSLLLVAVMLVGLFPSTLAADSNPEPRSLNATELTGLSRLDEEKQEPAENRQETPGYQPEDLVTVIVTLTVHYDPRHDGNGSIPAGWRASGFHWRKSLLRCEHGPVLWKSCPLGQSESAGSGPWERDF